jgi:hypothetical protein
LVGADLKQDVDVLMVFEDVFEFDDVVMAEGLVNFYLRYQFLFGSGAVECAFGDDFGC